SEIKEKSPGRKRSKKSWKRNYIYMKSLWREGRRNAFVAKSEQRQPFFGLLTPIGSRTFGTSQ
ncbi:MAG: hypothetical protein ACK559_33940, partial [bacterium]